VRGSRFGKYGERKRIERLKQTRKARLDLQRQSLPDKKPTKRNRKG
jgi:hypothetical protein